MVCLSVSLGLGLGLGLGLWLGLWLMLWLGLGLGKETLGDVTCRTQPLSVLHRAGEKPEVNLTANR